MCILPASGLIASCLQQIVCSIQFESDHSVAKRVKKKPRNLLNPPDRTCLFDVYAVLDYKQTAHRYSAKLFFPTRIRLGIQEIGKQTLSRGCDQNSGPTICMRFNRSNSGEKIFSLNHSIRFFLFNSWAKSSILEG